MDENWNELDILFNLIKLYKDRREVETNEEKAKLLDEIIENYEENGVLVNSYLIKSI